MTRPFLLSAGVNDPALATPGRLAAVLSAADAAGFDLLVLGSAADHPFDAQVLAAWAAPRSTSVGIVATVAADNAHPFHVARALSAVDFLADGRAGWSVVPGKASPAQADDFVRATRALWDGWDANCLIIDKASGVYLDPAKVRVPHYEGPFYSTLGPVNAMRPPQGHLVLVSDGAAPMGVPGVDIALIDAGQRLAATKSLAKVSADTSADDLALRFAAGEIDGAHFTLTAPEAQMPQIAARFAALGGARRGKTLRERLGLPLSPAALTPQLEAA